MKLAAAFGALLSFTALAAQAAPPLVSPVTIASGGSVHLTPIDQNSAPIPIAQCTIQNLPGTVATVSYDASGAVLAAVGAGLAPSVQWKCTDGTTSVLSAFFSVKANPPPYAVTAVGDTMP